MNATSDNSKSNNVNNTEIKTTLPWNTLSDNQGIQMLNDQWASSIAKPNVLIFGNSYRFTPDFIYDFLNQKALELGKSQDSRNLYKLISDEFIKPETNKYIDLIDFNTAQENIKQQITSDPQKYIVFKKLRGIQDLVYLDDKFYFDCITHAKSIGVILIDDINLIKYSDFQIHKNDIYSIVKDRKINNTKISDGIMIIATAYAAENPTSSFVNILEETDLLRLFYKVNYQTDPLEWIERNSTILDKDLLDFIKQSPDENLGVFPPTDPTVLNFPCPNKVETFNNSLIRLKERFHESNEYEHEVIFRQIIDEAALCCGVNWARSFLNFLHGGSLKNSNLFSVM